MASDRIYESFTRGYNEVQALYAQDKLSDCIDVARILVAEPAIPRHYRIRTHLLLASTVGDRDEAWYFHRKAEVEWHVVRRFHAKGEDATIDTSMDTLWDRVLGTKDMLKEEDHDEKRNGEREEETDKELQDTLAAHEAAIKDASDEQAALDEADAAYFGIPIAEVRQKTAEKAARKSARNTIGPHASCFESNPAQATDSTHTSTPAFVKPFSRAQEEMSAQSRAHGFGGGDKPFRAPTRKPSNK